MESSGKPFSRFLEHKFPSIFTNFPEEPAKEMENSVWNYYGYNRQQYRMFASLLPYVPPFLVSVANGILAGIILAFIVANGSIEGMDLYGSTGIITGALAGFTYFMAFILPHGIIEIPALFLAAALGYVFASRQSFFVKKEILFSGDCIEDLERDIRKTEKCAFTYLKSPNFRKTMFVCICLLLLASYIETQITPEIGLSVFNFVLEYLN